MSYRESFGRIAELISPRNSLRPRRFMGGPFLNAQVRLFNDLAKLKFDIYPGVLERYFKLKYPDLPLGPK